VIFIKNEQELYGLKGKDNDKINFRKSWLF